MAYKIQYTPESNRRYPLQRQRKPWQWSKILVIILLLGAVVWIRHVGLPDFLIPGETELTKAAVQSMMGNLQAGIPVGDAVTAFCKQIIYGS